MKRIMWTSGFVVWNPLGAYGGTAVSSLGAASLACQRRVGVN